MPGILTAKEFIEKLKTYVSPAELKKYERYFPPDKREGDQFIGVRMGQVFTLARTALDMPPAEIEKLLESPVHEVRAGAMSIMGTQATNKKIPEGRLKELYELYIRRHDRINSWDLVDLAAYKVVGLYLADKPRDILYKLARSKNPCERRTAIVSTGHFMLRQHDVDDIFKIAELLVHDKDDVVNKGTGWMLRTAGDIDQHRLLAFLDKYAAKMSRIALRYAIEHLSSEERKHYLGLKPS